jgi:hypothetical protein
MAGKRGRPLKDGDAATTKRRQLTLQRVRRFNERRNALLAEANAHSSPLKEASANRAQQRKDEAAATLLQLKDGCTLPIATLTPKSTNRQDGTCAGPAASSFLSSFSPNSKQLPTTH